MKYLQVVKLTCGFLPSEVVSNTHVTKPREEGEIHVLRIFLLLQRIVCFVSVFWSGNIMKDFTNNWGEIAGKFGVKMKMMMVMMVFVHRCSSGFFSFTITHDPSSRSFSVSNVLMVRNFPVRSWTSLSNETDMRLDPAAIIKQNLWPL